MNKRRVVSEKRHLVGVFFTICLCLLWSFESCGMIPLHPAETDFNTFFCGFETGNPHDYSWTDFSLSREDSLSMVTNPVKMGSYAARFEVRFEDKNDRGTRSELGLSDLYPHGSEVFYSWSVYLDPASQESGKWQIMGQWHDAPDPYQNESWAGYVPVPPPLAVDYTNGEFKLVLRSHTLWGEGKVIGTYGASRGQWIDMVFHIRWSENDDGFVRWWVDGTPLTGNALNEYKAYGRNCRNKVGNFFRIGLYRDGGVTTPFAAYYDEIKIGRTLQEVSP